MLWATQLLSNHLVEFMTWSLTKGGKLLTSSICWVLAWAPFFMGLLSLTLNTMCRSKKSVTKRYCSSPCLLLHHMLGSKKLGSIIFHQQMPLLGKNVNSRFGWQAYQNMLNLLIQQKNGPKWPLLILFPSSEMSCIVKQAHWLLALFITLTRILCKDSRKGSSEFHIGSNFIGFSVLKSKMRHF